MDNLDESLSKYEEAEDLSEVIELTEYDGFQNSRKPMSSSLNEVAEYHPIQVCEVDVSFKSKAESIVYKIKDFIIRYGGIEADTEMVEYLNQVAELEITGLADMMQLCNINKMMIQNMISRINVTMMEDYAAIQSYNTLVKQHMQLTKELQQRYRSIPMVMKRMKVDVETEQELQDAGDNVDEVITENYGETQFNNDKELLEILNGKNKDNK